MKQRVMRMLLDMDKVHDRTTDPMQRQAITRAIELITAAYLAQRQAPSNPQELNDDYDPSENEAEEAGFADYIREQQRKQDNS